MSIPPRSRNSSSSQERKALQAAGKLPSWYTTQGWQIFKKNAVPGEEGLLDRHRTISKTLARHMVGQEAEWEAYFFRELWDGVLSPASPALSTWYQPGHDGFVLWPEDRG